MHLKKLSILLAVFGLIFFTGCETPSLTGKKVEKEYFTGGKVRSEFTWSDKTGKNGTRKEYGYEGHMISTVNIRNGVKDGVETLFDQEGRVMRQVPYVNGKIHGIYKAFYPNGDRMITYTYQNGLRDGYAYSYYPDGKVHKKAIYRRGQLAN